MSVCGGACCWSCCLKLCCWMFLTSWWQCLFIRMKTFPSSTLTLSQNTDVSVRVIKALADRLVPSALCLHSALSATSRMLTVWLSSARRPHACCCCAVSCCTAVWFSGLTHTTQDQSNKEPLGAVFVSWCQGTYVQYIYIVKPFSVLLRLQCDGCVNRISYDASSVVVLMFAQTSD